MRYGMSVIVRGDAAGPETFNAQATQAEALEWDCLWVSDHLLMPAMRVSRYPGRSDGELPSAWKRTYYQPFSVLNYLAAQTQTVRLGISVLILPMRNPIEMAAQIAEMDQLSSGRVNLGIGVGWFREEFEALGYDFDDRGARTDEGLSLIKALWSNEKTTFNGRYHQFEAAETGPKPIQKPHPPIYIGGDSPGALERLAREGDVWHPFRITPDGLAAALPKLTAALADAGRSPEDCPIAPKIPLTFQDHAPATGQAPTEGRPQDILAALRLYQELGATEFCFDIMTETLPVALETMVRFNEEIRPHLH